MKKFAILISTAISLQSFAADYQTTKEENVGFSKQEIRKNNAQIESEIKRSIENIVSPVSKYEIQEISYMSETNAEVKIGLKETLEKQKENKKTLVIKFSKEEGNWSMEETVS